MVQVSPDMIHKWELFLAFGIVLALLAAVAIVRSSAATAASTMLFGWLLLDGGFIEFAGSPMVGRWIGFFLYMLAAILLLVTGFPVLKGL